MYGLLYAEINIFAFILFMLTLLSQIHYSREDHSSRQRVFRLLLLLCLGAFFADSCYGLSLAGLFPQTRALVYLCNGVYFFCIIPVPFVWFTFSEYLYDDSFYLKSRPVQIAAFVPVALCELLLFSNVWTDCFFTVGADGGYRQAAGVYVQKGIGCLYLVAVGIRAVYVMLRARGSGMHTRGALIIGFIVMPLLGVLCSLFTKDATVVAIGIAVAVSFLDVWILKADEESKLKDSLWNSRLVEVLGADYIDIMVLDLAGDTLRSVRNGPFASSAFREYGGVGIPMRQFFDTYIDTLVYSEDREELHRSLDRDFLCQNLRYSSMLNLTYRLITETGLTHYCRLKCAPVKNEKKEIVAIVFGLEDVDDEVNMQRLATTDSLTKLPNKNGLFNAFDLNFGDRVAGQDLYLMIISLANLKEINAAHNHTVGDEVLVRTANIIGTIARANDGLPVRYKGSVFMVLCAKYAEQEMRAMKERILADVARANERTGADYTVELRVAYEKQRMDEGLMSLINRTKDALSRQ